MIIKTFPTACELADAFAAELVKTMVSSAAANRILTVALSGGNTPGLLFSILAEKYGKTAPWEYVHFFWGDERMLPSDSPDSNFGTAKKLLLDKIAIPSGNIHQISGDNDPEMEAERYSLEIKMNTRENDGLPVFDVIILGLGEDGHTASIFPGKTNLFNSDKICDAVRHPSSFQYRITITGRVINNCRMVYFLVTGSKKAKVVSEVINNQGNLDYPASLVNPIEGKIEWYLDDPASELISRGRIM